MMNNQYSTQIRTAISTLACFAAGIILFEIGIYLTGYLAAIVIPRAFFNLFGRVTIGLSLFKTVTIAIPIATLVSLGSAAAALMAPIKYRYSLAACLSGYVLDEASTIVSSTPATSDWTGYFGAIYDLPLFLAGPAGVLVAGYVLSHFHSRRLKRFGG